MKILSTHNHPIASVGFGILGLAFTTVGLTAQIIFTEGFETDGEGSRYFATGAFSDGADDYFIRTDGFTQASGIPAYTSFSGDWFWAAEDVDGPLNPSGVSYIDFPNIPVLDFPQIRITLDVAAGAASVYDSVNDFVLVRYRVDGTPWEMALAFQNDGVRFNSGLHQDFDFDGVGEGEILTLQMRTFSSAILPISGSWLDIRIDVLMDANLEAVAFDNLTVIAVPEPSTYAVLMAASALLVAMRRKNAFYS